MTAVKLDENLGTRLLHLAQEAGHDAASVRSQSMTGASDTTLFERCKAEQRILITLDLDFSNPLRFPPAGTAGTIVLRPHRPAAAEIESLFNETLRRLVVESPSAKIWIVEPGRIRIFWDWDAGE